LVWVRNQTSGAEARGVSGGRRRKGKGWRGESLSDASSRWMILKRRYIFIFIGEPPIELDNVANKVKAFNDYSIIIQEYFLARVTDFLENYAT
jgi:hypothetical protein